MLSERVDVWLVGSVEINKSNSFTGIEDPCEGALLVWEIVLEPHLKV
jgi:hypothetical protein